MSWFQGEACLVVGDPLKTFFFEGHVGDGQDSPRRRQGAQATAQASSERCGALLQVLAEQRFQIGSVGSQPRFCGGIGGKKLLQ